MAVSAALIVGLASHWPCATDTCYGLVKLPGAREVGGERGAIAPPIEND